MLHEFLTANRNELIRRCRSKVSKRDSPPVGPVELEYGVPLFLEQLVEALRSQQHAVISGPGTTRLSRSKAVVPPPCTAKSCW